MKEHRWNFEEAEDGVSVCKGEHEKGQPCVYEKLSPFEVVGIINKMRSKLLNIEYTQKLTKL